MMIATGMDLEAWRPLLEATTGTPSVSTLPPFADCSDANSLKLPYRLVKPLPSP